MSSPVSFTGTDEGRRYPYPKLGSFPHGLKAIPLYFGPSNLWRHMSFERSLLYRVEENYSTRVKSDVIPRLQALLDEKATNVIQQEHSVGGYPAFEYLFEMGEDTLVYLGYSAKHLDTHVAAKTQERAKSIFDALRKDFFDESVPENETKVYFWNNSAHGSTYRERSLSLPPWAEIEDNYPSSIKDEISALISCQPEDDSGLILWTGEPGTGKTTALRALIENWSNFAQIDIITDPEQMLNDISYLNNVILTMQSGDSEEFKPKLVILEDAGELITSDAKYRSGPALARLLNVTDGLLGQGTNTYVLVTTNEAFSDLHEAASRNGRCISHTDFVALSEDESKTWLDSKGGDSSEVTSGQTIANLYGLLKGQEVKTTRSTKKSFGFAT